MDNTFLTEIANRQFRSPDKWKLLSQIVDKNPQSEGARFAIHQMK
jgi:hypothetical protein